MQGQFESATHGGAVDECERGDGQLSEPTEDVMAELGELFDDAGVGDNSDGRQISTHREDEGLSRDADTDDAGRRGCLVKGGLQRTQTLRPERRRARVVSSVVQGDEAKGAAGYVDKTEFGFGDDLVGECHVSHVASSSTRSQITVPPIPRPIHIVVMPYRASGLASKSRARFVIKRIPLDARG